jgi:hypothetical protein
VARLQSSFKSHVLLGREHLPGEQGLPKQLQSPLCFSISANTRKSLKLRIKVPCHGNIFQPSSQKLGSQPFSLVRSGSIRTFGD